MGNHDSHESGSEEPRKTQNTRKRRGALLLYLSCFSRISWSSILCGTQSTRPAWLRRYFASVSDLAISAQTRTRSTVSAGFPSVVPMRLMSATVGLPGSTGSAALDVTILAYIGAGRRVSGLSD